jgi:hypothetical protein
MDDIRAQFKDFIMPTAPSILYEKQHITTGISKKTNSNATKGSSIAVNITAFMERTASTIRVTPRSMSKR